MTAQLSCHVENSIAITSPKLGWKQNKISIEFELPWKIVREMVTGVQSSNTDQVRFSIKSHTHTGIIVCVLDIIRFEYSLWRHNAWMRYSRGNWIAHGRFTTTINAPWKQPVLYDDNISGISVPVHWHPDNK